MSDQFTAHARSVNGDAQRLLVAAARLAHQFQFGGRLDRPDHRHQLWAVEAFDTGQAFGAQRGQARVVEAGACGSRPRLAP